MAEIAQIEAAGVACGNGEGGQSQMGMNMCSGEESDKIDALLNEVYMQKMSSLPPAQKLALRKEERAWVAQKIQALKEVRADDGGGSITPTDENETTFQLTKTRIMNLMK